MVDQIVEEKTRVCVKCLKELPIGNFYRQATGRRRRDCAACCRAYARPKAKVRYHRVKDTEQYKEGKRVRQKRNRAKPERKAKDKEWNRNFRLKRLDWEKKSQMRTKYGLTMEQYWAMMTAQEQKCPICGRGLVYRSERYCAEVACVDHCHKSGKVRALLCGPCNVGLGSLGDDPLRMEAAAAYLRRHT